MPIRLFPSYAGTMSAGIQVDRSKETSRSAVNPTHPSTVLDLAVLYTMNETGVNSFRQDTVHHNGKGRQLPFAFTRVTVHHEVKGRQLRFQSYCTLFAGRAPTDLNALMPGLESITIHGKRKGCQTRVGMVYTGLGLHFFVFSS